MPELIKAKEPFIFYTRLHLTELTGLRASTLGQLLKLIKEVPDSCIYHHTHRFLQQHQYLSPEPPNDFSYWAAEVIGEDELGERLASIDTVQFGDIQSLRQRIDSTIEQYLGSNPLSKSRFANEGEVFHFMKSVSFIIPTDYAAYDLRDFCQILKKVTIDSIYFHIFEARLRLGKRANDFSEWIDSCLGERELAEQISRLDPYTRTLEDLRNILVRLIEPKTLE